MKKVMSFWKFLMSFSQHSAGEKELNSKLMSSGTGSCCNKFQQQLLTKVMVLAEENRRLKEELRLRDLHENCTHDV